MRFLGQQLELQKGTRAPILPETFAAYLAVFQDCFTAPSFQRFLTIMTGWVVCTGKHTVTGVMRAAGVVGKREHSGYHRFFSRGAWEPDVVGVALMKLVLTLLPKKARVVMAIDDTLARHTGKHISSAGMHRDALLSNAARPFWHFGHNWIVLAVVVEFPRWEKTFSLPVLVRLYRTQKANAALGRRHQKLTELACELLGLVSENFPDREFVVVGDNNYVNCSVFRPLPDNIDFVGRGRMDAALYAPAPPYSGRGRPRVRGRKLASPKARRDKWKKLRTEIYGRRVTIQVRVFDAVWYKVSYRRSLRFVVIRGWPGHSKDDVLVTTDLHHDASDVIRLYCQRWSLEETFGWVKSRLGLEDPQNRTEHAVQRTAPMALWTYTLVLVWAHGRRSFSIRRAPWYRGKTNPSFADILAALRRQSWTLWLCDQPAPNRLDQKDLEPLLDAVGYA